MEENSNDQVTVLVVDDEPNIVELLTVSLKFQGFNVRSANSGTEALRIAREINP
ncbi:MAG: DNA-binding response regulator, partial [Corynebacterium casei]|nr:DNA-binding response regulator [Corynebacterium casei]